MCAVFHVLDTVHQDDGGGIEGGGAMRCSFHVYGVLCVEWCVLFLCDAANSSLCGTLAVSPRIQWIGGIPPNVAHCSGECTYVVTLLL